MLIYVYGTLKKNFGANDLLQPARLVAEEVPIFGFKMYTNGSFPMVVNSENTKDKVFGEVWEIEEDILRRLDRYEGHPNLFTRDWIPSEQLGFNTDLGVQMYYYNRLPGGVKVESGRFEPHYFGSY